MIKQIVVGKFLEKCLAWKICVSGYMLCVNIMTTGMISRVIQVFGLWFFCILKLYLEKEELNIFFKWQVIMNKYLHSFYLYSKTDLACSIPTYMRVSEDSSPTGLL